MSSCCWCVENWSELAWPSPSRLYIFLFQGRVWSISVSFKNKIVHKSFGLILLLLSILQFLCTSLQSSSSRYFWSRGKLINKCTVDKLLTQRRSGIWRNWWEIVGTLLKNCSELWLLYPDSVHCEFSANVCRWLVVLVDELFVVRIRLCEICQGAAAVLGTTDCDPSCAPVWRFFCCCRDEFSHIEAAVKGKLLTDYLGGEARIAVSNLPDRNL